MGCLFPVRAGIPRFVPRNHYAVSFGLQWKKYQKTQLDSFTGHPISGDRLARCVGGDLNCVRGRLVLEAGCGAGRFSEVLLNHGANLVACDLSQAVEANYANNRGRDNYFVAQADILAPPFAEGTFDYVICLGVIQHTPSPEETIRALARNVRPGGTLVLDHYSPKMALGRVGRAFRRFLLGMPPRSRLPLCSMVVHGYWPIHRLVRRYPKLWRLKVLSPVFDYSDAMPFLTTRQLKEWALLDTHDAHTDYFKHLRTPEQITACLRDLGLEDINVWTGGNGVEARARKPLAAS
jgi:SAM-dependent methyltransferase